MSDDTAVVGDELDLEVTGDEDLPTLFNILSKGLESVDAEMDSWNPAAGQRKAFVAEVDAEQQDIWQPQAEKLISQLNERDERTRYAIYHGLTDALNKAFSKSYTTWVENQVEALPKPETVAVDEGRKAYVRSKRSEWYQMCKQIYDTASLFGQNWVESVEMPKIRRGGSGKRSAKALSLYDYWVDGRELSGDENTTLGVAKLLGYEKSSDLTKLLKGIVVKGDNGKDQKFNTSKPPTRFEVSVEGKDGARHTITAQKSDDSDSEEDDSEDEGDDDDE